ncbi:hypothetical protein KUTG_02627 [Kutzneria sp. 744]|nr:hypothetical protein KUTG_02627 [Kutzneria sp. 744]
MVFVLFAAVLAQGTSEFMLSGLLPSIATVLAVMIRPRETCPGGRASNPRERSAPPLLRPVAGFFEVRHPTCPTTRAAAGLEKSSKGEAGA